MASANHFLPPPLEATYINRGVHILQKVASTTDRNNGQVAVGKVWGALWTAHLCTSRPSKAAQMGRYGFIKNLVRARARHAPTIQQQSVAAALPTLVPPHIDPCGDAAFAAFRSHCFFFFFSPLLFSRRRSLVDDCFTGQSPGSAISIPAAPDVHEGLGQIQASAC